MHWLLTEQEWDYFHFVDIGLDRMQHGFWNYFDPKHAQFEPGNSFSRMQFLNIIDGSTSRLACRSRSAGQ